MTRPVPDAWLRAREPDPPPSLADRMTEALDGVSPAENAWEALLEAAVAALDRALESGGRDTALDLLAADALLTHAAESAAEASAEDLESFLERSGPATFATRFAER